MLIWAQCHFQFTANQLECSRSRLPNRGLGGEGKGNEKAAADRVGKQGSGMAGLGARRAEGLHHRPRSPVSPGTGTFSRLRWQRTEVRRQERWTVGLHL